MPRSYTLLIFILLLAGNLFAQERLYSIETNSTIKKQSENTIKQYRKSAKDNGSILLPFFDDFSKISVWPSTARWVDNYAFINTDYALNPPTIGVATLDDLDANGDLYPNAGPYQFDADRLTSRPIRLDSIFTPVPKALNVSDSLYLSFYYQPQGRGSTPSKKDSLLLEFHSPLEFDPVFGTTDTTFVPHWRTVWSSAGGIQVDTFAIQQNGYFKQILIPITDTALYFKNGFQFRFRNYGSLANNYVPDWQSNGDQWNLDLVYLNIDRTIKDTTIKDVAFADRAPSLLKNYEAMPYRQYADNFVVEMKDSIDIKVANLDAISQNISYKFTLQQDSQAPYFTYDGGSFTILPYKPNGYLNYPPISKPSPNIFYSPTVKQDAVAFNSIHSLTVDPGMLYSENDTITFSQVLSNYYAYDDGTAEAGIGLNGSTGSYAVRFALNKPDTLIGLQIYFNHVKSSMESAYIDLVIWNEKYGKPGLVIHTVSGASPFYTDSLNSFHTYWFETPVIINTDRFPGLIFYAGWHQNLIDNLNVGLDRYNDTHQNRFYLVDTAWQMSDSQHAGSLLLRPIVGKANPLSIASNKERSVLKIYPNPVTNNNIHIELPSNWDRISHEDLLVIVYNSAGIAVSKQAYSEELNLSALSPGFYLLKLINIHSGDSLTSKLLMQ
ncbi:MAG: T9SS type A sorting domain-containing protein [Bacteroidetes bacterium]|nr:T9SS type A sorting domain-containing protein [Bacteroidota bacterium]